MGMGGNGNGNGFMIMGGNENRNSPSCTPLLYGVLFMRIVAGVLQKVHIKQLSVLFLSTRIHPLSCRFAKNLTRNV